MRAHLDTRRARIRVAACAGGAGGQGGRRAVAGRRGEAAHVPGRPIRRRSGPELDQLQADHREPQVDGYITRIRPDLTYMNGSVPRVDVIHLHHGVWLNMSRQDATARPAGAVLRCRRGEDDACSCRRATATAQGDRQLAPERHDPQPHAEADAGVHDLTRSTSSRRLGGRARDQARAPDLDGRAERPRLSGVQRAEGHRREGRVHLSRRPRTPTAAASKKNQWIVDRPGVLVATAGHVHPGGLHTTLVAGRGSRCARGKAAAKARATPLFRVGGEVLRARRPRLVGRGHDGHTEELAGAASARAICCATSATYETRRASW